MTEGQRLGRSLTRRKRAWLIAVAALVLAGVLAVSFVQAVSPRPEVPTTEATATPSAAPDAGSTEDVRAIAQRRLDDHLEECTAEGMRGGVFPAECGIAIPWGTDFVRVDGGEFRIERLPVLEVIDDGFVAQAGVLVATLTGVGHDGAARTETYRTDTWSVRGDLTGKGEDLELTVW